MKNLIQFFLVAAILFVVSFGLNYMIIQADPNMNFENVVDPITYGCTMFSVVISMASLIYLPPKTRKTT